jgi:ubiquinone/menaquinone biosynthesis C-methylase UbiE
VRPTAHNELVQREFTQQAASFEDPRYSFGDPRLMAWILSHVPVEPDFTVLDVAAGTGHLARALAPHVHHVIAFDLTAEMLATGKRQAEAAGVANVLFERGDAARLPYLDGSFDLVVSRFAVHHFDEPAVQLGEMVRVCRSGGQVAVIDLVATDPASAASQNDLERLRDPSHTTALSAESMAALLEAAGAKVEQAISHDQPLDVDRWLAQARTPPDVGERIRARLRAELQGGPASGMRPFEKDGGLRLEQRWTIFLASKST